MDKKVFYLVGSIGSIIGGYIPVMFGAGGLSLWSILGSLIGGVGAIILVNQLTK